MKLSVHQEKLSNSLTPDEVASVHRRLEARGWTKKDLDALKKTFPSGELATVVK